MRPRAMSIAHFSKTKPPKSPKSKPSTPVDKMSKRAFSQFGKRRSSAGVKKSSNLVPSPKNSSTSSKWRPKSTMTTRLSESRKQTRIAKKQQEFQEDMDDKEDKEVEEENSDEDESDEELTNKEVEDRSQLYNELTKWISKVDPTLVTHSDQVPTEENDENEVLSAPQKKTSLELLEEQRAAKTQKKRKPILQRPSSLSLINADDPDNLNPRTEQIKVAWKHLSDYESVMNDLLGDMDLSELISDFMAHNLIRMSKKLRDITYAIEEIDDINSRRTLEERAVINQLLDVFDAEEERKNDFSNEVEQSLFEKHALSRKEKRAKRRSISLWAMEDAKAAEAAQKQHDISCQTTIDYFEFNKFYKKIDSLTASNNQKAMCIEDITTQIPIKIDKAVQEAKDVLHAHYRENQPEMTQAGVQTDKVPAKVVYREKITEVDNSIHHFKNDFQQTMNSISDQEMPASMKGMMGNLMGLMSKDADLRREERRLEEEYKRMEKKHRLSKKKREAPMVVTPSEASSARGDSPPNSARGPLHRYTNNPISNLQKKSSKKIHAPSRRRKSNTSKIKKNEPLYRAPPPFRPKAEHRFIQPDDFELSANPEKWEIRRALIRKRQLENMMAILRCFYTIVYEGTQHGYFKSLIDDQPVTVKSQPSSHHFQPDWTGQKGFENLMDSLTKQRQDSLSQKKPISPTPRRPASSSYSSRPAKKKKMRPLSTLRPTSSAIITVPSGNGSPALPHLESKPSLHVPAQEQEGPPLFPPPSARSIGSEPMLLHSTSLKDYLMGDDHSDISASDVGSLV